MSTMVRTLVSTLSAAQNGGAVIGVASEVAVAVIGPALAAAAVFYLVDPAHLFCFK